MGLSEGKSVGERARLVRRTVNALPTLVLAGFAAWVTFGEARPTSAQTAEPVRLLSTNAAAASGNGGSNGIAVNSDGTIGAFYSDASDLVSGDTNQARDIFVRDTNTGTTERVSVSSTDDQADGPSHLAGGPVAISGDGQVVGFYSLATNLVSGDTNQQADVFVRLRALGITQRVSVASDGTQGNGPSVLPSVSADGRLIAFQSEANNLVAGDTNGVADIFVHDRISGLTERVCNLQGNKSSSTPAISDDGNVVAFASSATNFVPDDTNNFVDIFVCDRSTGNVERVSVSSSGAEGNGDSILPALSADGRFVGFKSLANNLVDNDFNGLVDVFVFDRQTRTTERISVSMSDGNANDLSIPPTISDDGRFVAFGSFATNIVANDINRVSDVFVRDRQIGVTVIADVNDSGEEANGGTPDIQPSISGDGKHVGFASVATNLSDNDRNQAGDVFIAQNPFYGPNGCPDGTCSDGNVCVKGFCASPTSTPTMTNTPTPTRTGTPTKTPTPTATFRMCVDDTDCKPDEHCRAGFCKKKRECDDDDPTIDRLNCFDREACIGNLCECGGDCNLDGIVQGNEVTNAVYVLGGLLPLQQCSAADIDGDGQVMGNEVTETVLNLSRGCAQEGRPLIFAHDRGGMVTLTINAISNTDGTATVAVDMSGGGGEVATVQLDLLFDPTVFDVGDPGASCHLDPRLTSEIIAATLPISPPAPEGLQRLRLFVGDLSAPIATFDDGRVLTCTFKTRATASTDTTLAADRLNIGDAQADTFGAAAVSGGISILIPTPSPAAAPSPGTICPGDCDGDGEVFGSEITTVVQVMAGQLPLSACPAADSDSDGQVMVTDVTRAVISLGRGCPQ